MGKMRMLFLHQGPSADSSFESKKKKMAAQNFFFFNSEFN